MAAETETLTITLPADLAQGIRNRVVRGGFASENELIVHDLAEADEWSAFPDQPLGSSLEEILTSIPEQIARIERGEEKLLSHEELVQNLSSRRAAFLGK